MKNSWLIVFLLMFGMAAAFNKPAMAQEEDVKHPLQGLISMGDVSFHRNDGETPDNSLEYIFAKPGVLDGVVLNFTWAQLEPQPNALTTEVIDQALKQVRSYNKRYPKTPLGVRLRIYAGPNAPKWVKKLGGSPVEIQYRGINLTIGRFWSTSYNRAWRNFQKQLAEKYDTDLLINEVAMTSCSSITSEPFVFAGGEKSLKSMHKAGLSDGKYRKCLMQAPEDYKDWQHTSIEYAFNSFRLSDSGVPNQASTVMVKTMNMWRKKLGSRGIVSNHKLQSPTPRELTPIYSAIRKVGPPIEFQLNAPKGLDWDATIRYGVSLGASAIEIWPETFTQIPSQKLKQWSRSIKHN